MKWYGILALMVLLGALAGVVYLGMNTEKFYESKGNSIEGAILLNCNDDDDKFLCFGNAFDSCTQATFNHIMITDEGSYPITVEAYVTDECKIHITNDNGENMNSKPIHRELLVGQCNEIQITDDFMDIEQCEFSENMGGSVRVWKMSNKVLFDEDKNNISNFVSP